MFGIGLPEMIIILAVALIVVGPDKLPELARSLAKGMVEMKKTMHQLKNSLDEEGNLEGIKSELNKTEEELKEQLIDNDFQVWQPEKTPYMKSAAESDNPRPWETDGKKDTPDEKATTEDQETDSAVVDDDKQDATPEDSEK